MSFPSHTFWSCLMLTLLSLIMPLSAGDPPAQGAMTVWVDSPWRALKADLTAPAAPTLALKLAAVRGGIASGVVIVSGANGPVTAKGDALKGPGGAIPLRLRYATRKRDLGPAAGFAMAGKQLDASFDFGNSAYLDALSETPVAGDPVQPVWVTADVPVSAKAGTYAGTLTVQGKTVTVALTVADFTMPPLGERRLYVNAYPSHDTVAIRYGVAPWSDQHFALLEPSLALAGRIGTNILYVPIIGNTYAGHRTGMVFFTRKGEDLVPDFTAFERYLALWVKSAGKPRFAVINVWDADNRTGAKSHPTVELTVKQADGTFAEVSFPSYDKVGGFLKTAVAGIQQRLNKLGLEKHQVLFGQSNDQVPEKDVAAVFTAIDPEMRWSAWTHGYPYSGTSDGLRGAEGQFMTLTALPDQSFSLDGAVRGVPALPAPKTLIRIQALRMFLRGSWGDHMNFQWRVAPDVSFDGKHSGYGPVGLDVWPLPPEKKEGKRGGDVWSLKKYYGPNLDREQASCCTVAGPKGALATTRLEGLAEGGCEAEAHVAIELAIAAKKLDPAIAKPILMARYKGFERTMENTNGKYYTYVGIDLTGKAPVPADWTDTLAALYDLAAKAQAALK